MTGRGRRWPTGSFVAGPFDAYAEIVVKPFDTDYGSRDYRPGT